MLSNSQPVQAATRLPGATSQARYFRPLNASALTEKATENTLAMVFHAWHKTPQEDTGTSPATSALAAIAGTLSVTPPMCRTTTATAP